MDINFFIDYLRYERNYSVHTIVAYSNDLQQFEGFLNSLGKQIDMKNADADIVRKWIVYLMKQSYSSAAINRKLSTLQSYFKFLIRQGVIKKNPIRLLTGPKKSKSLPYFIKEKDMNELLDEESKDEHFETIRNRLIMEILYETGMRCSELVGIKNADVDTETMILKVTGKRNKQRLIPFAELLKEKINQYNNVRAREAGKENDYFFVRKDGRKITSAIVYYLVKKQLSTISTLSRRSPHILRHTFATSMLNDGAEISAVRNLLGHGSLASTSIYTHVTFEELKKIYNAHPRAQKIKEN
ncbi:MAG: tyrosine-type recombinase/integrase [Tannerella sp.]|jgi:integrase/recombinase XerC|nr:tyrosine-type recombinase/integrase [Tannerella sp.]